MSGPVVRLGSTGPLVEELQRLLNTRLTPSPNLVLDGQFESHTRAAVLRFQAQNWLVEDGEAGGATFNALRRTETYADLHRIRLVMQPTRTSCWAASTAMLLGLPNPVDAPDFMKLPDGSLRNDSELENPLITAQYAARFHLRIFPPMSWLPSALAGVLHAGAVMVNVLKDAAAYAGGQGSSGHMVVFAGIRGDGSADATTIQVHDPWPPGRGAIYSVSYGRLMRYVPTATYQLYQR